MMKYIVILSVVLVVYWFLFNPTTKRIRKIQSLLNKDLSLCDVINSLNGWEIGPIQEDGLRIIINPASMPMYSLYITYRGKRPSNSEIKKLYFELTKNH